MRLVLSRHAARRYRERGGRGRIKVGCIEGRLAERLRRGVQVDSRLGVPVVFDGWVWICEPRAEGGWVVVTVFERGDPQVLRWFVPDLRAYVQQLLAKLRAVESQWNETTDPELLDVLAYQREAIRRELDRVIRLARRETGCDGESEPAGPRAAAVPAMDRPAGASEAPAPAACGAER